MEQQPTQLSISDLQPIVCEKCGHDLFVPVVYLRRINKFLVGAPNDIVRPFEAFSCAKCGHVNDEFKIKEFEEEKEQNSSLIL